MKRIISIVLMLSLALACLASCNKVEGYEGYLEHFEKKAERVNVFDKDGINAYGSLISYGGASFADFIVNMFYAVMEDGTSVRCVELLTEFDANQYAKICGSTQTNAYCLVDGVIVLHGSTPEIEKLEK